ncbi:MAG: 50S ribosome-binding GTPase [Victivallales bacterium]|nr:50S ribosome-binding GTPase [Victivallales bacterium]
MKINTICNRFNNTQTTGKNNMDYTFLTADLDSKIMNLIKNAPGLGDYSELLFSKWLELKNQKLNIMITGATGSGKSSTINALFNMDSAKETTEIAKVGVGVDPETMNIVKYELGNMNLWDSPGLGDGYEADRLHARHIIDKLQERDANGKYLIDLVLVILDGGSRDLGTSYELINKVIIPNLGSDKSKRILVAINQADNAMKGHYWDYENNRPEQKLVDFLEEKCQSVRRRIKEGTGVDIEPIYYSAGYKEDGKPQGRPYNLAKLLYFILDHIPAEKRLTAVSNINTTEEIWDDNDSTEYAQKCRSKLRESISLAFKGAALGGMLGTAIGSLVPGIGSVIGGTIGTVLGGIGGFIGGLFEW